MKPKSSADLCSGCSYFNGVAEVCLKNGAPEPIPAACRDFRRPYNASQPQEDYCSDCLIRQEGACNVILKDGEECGDKITEEERDFAIASGDFNL